MFTVYVFTCLDFINHVDFFYFPVYAVASPTLIAAYYPMLLCTLIQNILNPSLKCIHVTNCKMHALQMRGRVEFGYACLFWTLLTGWYTPSVEWGYVDTGRRERDSKLSSLLDALCSSLKVLYPIWYVLTSPWDVFRRVPTDQMLLHFGNRV